MKKYIRTVCILLLVYTSTLVAGKLTAPSSYYENQKILLSLKNLNGNNGDWVGIYPKGSSNAWKNVQSWTYTNGRKSMKEQGIKKGTIELSGIKAGEYEARLFFNNSYKLEEQVSLVVLSGLPSIVAFKKNFSLDESIDINFKNLPSNNGDWIGIYPKGSSTAWENVLRWSYTNGTKSMENRGKKQGTLSFNSLDVGEYEARLFFKNSYYLVRKSSFSVENKLLDKPMIQMSKESYESGEKIQVTLSNLAGNSDDWVGIYPKGTTNAWKNVQSWSFTNGTKAKEKEGIINGTLDLEGLKAGEYEARLFFNNSYIMENSSTFSVIQKRLLYPKETTLQKRLTDATVFRPEKGASTYDKVFGTKITRINKSDTAISSYPKVQAWNSDQTLLRIGSRLYDGETFIETAWTKNVEDPYKTLCKRSSDYFRWSNVHPNIFYVLNSSKEFVQGKITGNRVDCSTVLESFDEYDLIHIGPDEGNIDYNDRYVVFTIKKFADDRVYALLFDIKNRTRVWKEAKVIPENKWIAGEPSVLDWISVSPSGKYLVLNERTKNNYQDGLYRYDIHFQNGVKLQFEYNGKLYSEAGHGDIGYDQNNNEVYVTFLTGLGVHSFNLDKPHEIGKELLTSPYGGGHVSCQNRQRKGWCYITTREDGYKQVYALKLDGTNKETVENFAQTHVIGTSYSEEYGLASPDGTKVIFNSYWGNADKEVIDTYVAEVR